MPASSSQPFSSKPCESVKFLGGCLPDAVVVVFLVVQLQFKFAFCVSAEGMQKGTRIQVLSSILIQRLS